MRKNIDENIFILFLVFLTFFIVQAVPAICADTIAGPQLPFFDTGAKNVDRNVDQEAFKPGEFLKLRVTYIGLTAGYIEVEVEEAMIGGRDLYTLNMKAYTGGAGDWFYSASDRLISYVDARGLFSWGYDFYKEHEDESSQTKVRYHHGQGFFTENGSREGEIPRYTQDLLSAVYYVRTQELEVGQTYRFPIHSSDRSYDLSIEVEAVEKVATNDGWRKAYRLVPRFKNPTDRDEAFEKIKSVGGVKLWISKDKHKIPLQISVPATFGSLYGYLNEYSPGE